MRFGNFRDIQKRELISDCVVAPTVEVIEGAEVFDVVCPVSKFTGHRESAFKLLGKLTGAKADLLNVALQEIPSLASDSRLTDEDRVAAIVDRLSTGTPAEDSLMAERLMADIDALGLSSRSAENVQRSADTISFEGNKESEIVDNV